MLGEPDGCTVSQYLADDTARFEKSLRCLLLPCYYSAVDMVNVNATRVSVMLNMVVRSVKFV